MMRSIAFGGLPASAAALAAAALAVALAAPLPGWAAGEAMSPEEFREYAEGYTLYFERDGQPWGSESYSPGGRVTWRQPDGQCVPGVWKGHEGRVCFYYGEGTEVLCWAMERSAEGLVGQLETPGRDQGLKLTIARRDRQPLLCGDASEPL
ncbi:MAG: hypothetical protein AAF074_03385 [Pseudomonadota bacterium]